MKSYTVSVRDKQEQRPILRFLRNQFGFLPLAEIESVWGFVEPCILYGGRQFIRPQISTEDVRLLNEAGIGLRLPLTNHHCSDDDYDRSMWLLDKYHNPLNSVIVVRDDLAERIRKDFPHYSIEASVIKNLRTHERINKALEIYDSVVPPMDLNDDTEFLGALPKDNIRLFANAACAYNCPSKVCYPSISRFNRGESREFLCSQSNGKHPGHLGMTDFDVDVFEDMGFSKFKLLRHKTFGHIQSDS